MVNDLELSQVLRDAHKNKGSMNDVVSHFYPSVAPDSEEFKKLKTKIQSQLTELRKKLVATCKSEGVDPARVDIVLPKFRAGGKKGSRLEALQELFGLIKA